MPPTASQPRFVPAGNATENVPSAPTFALATTRFSGSPSSRPSFPSDANAPSISSVSVFGSFGSSSRASSPHVLARASA